MPVIIGNMLPILTLPVFTRHLSTTEYGVYALSQVYSIFLNGIANFGLTAGFERNYFECKNELQRIGLLFASTIFVITTSTLFIFITYFIGDFVQAKIFLIEGFPNLFFWSYFSTALAGYKMYFLTYFKNSENAKLFAFYSIDEIILNTLFSLIFILWLKIGVYGLIYGQLAASGMVFLLLITRFMKRNPFSFYTKGLIDSLKISLPLTPKIFFGVIGNQIDKYLIGLLSNSGGVGIYNIAQKIANVSFTFMTAIQNVFSPQVYKRMFELDSEEGGKSIGIYLTPFFYISVFVSLFIGLFCEEIIMILLPESYHGAINVTSVFSILYCSYFFSKHPQLIYAKKTILSSLLFIISIVLNILINIPFAKLWGAIGVAYGSLLAGLIWGFLYFLISQKYYFIKWEKKKVLTISICFFTAISIQVLLRSTNSEYLYRLLIKLIAIFTFIYLGFYFDIINKEKIRSLVTITKI